MPAQRSFHLGFSILNASAEVVEARSRFAAEERRIRSLVAEEEAGSSGIHCCLHNIATLRPGSPWLWGGTVCLFAQTDICFY